MAITLASLLAPKTRQQWRDQLLTELRDAGFAVSLAPSGDNRRNVVEMIAAGFAKADEVIGRIAAGAFLDDAPGGGWLELRARSGYAVEAKVAAMAVGVVRLTCAATAGPHVIAPGSLWVGRAATGATPARRYQNTTGGTLPSGGTLDLSVSAEAPGASYNLGNGQVRTLFSGLPGVSVNNPGPGGGATWLTSLGTDAEAPAPLRARCRDRWGTLGAGADDAAYRYLASSASAEVTRVRVYAGPADGTVRVLLAGETGSVTPSAVALAAAAIERRHPLTDVPAVQAAGVTTVIPTGTVSVRAPQLVAAQAAADTARLALLASLDVGEALDLGAIYAVLRQPGVTDVDLTTPAGDTTIPYDHVAGLDLSALTWAAVA